ncbi:MAG: glucose-6-phosphate isomerase [Lachnospiraceae bacterium]|nr:glucose-6-phosphate isomerase [Lachnospiraceae bacterium]
MEHVCFEYTTARKYIGEEVLLAQKKVTEKAKGVLLTRSGKGCDYLGWLDLPESYNKEEFVRIQRAANRIRGNSKVFVVIGIGGSYVGARAGIEFLGHNFFNSVDEKYRNSPEIYFAGNNISASYLNDLLQTIGERDFSINIISKSGETLEILLAARVLKNALVAKYGKKEAARRIYVTTGKQENALRKMAMAEDLETFVIPDEVGGNYTILTAAGLLPMAVSGINIEEVLKGAEKMHEHCYEAPYEQNSAMLYAAARNYLAENGKNIEILSTYEPYAERLAEWWKQLFGETEGKEKKGIFPACASMTNDIYTLGQFIQDGARIIFETVINIKYTGRDIFCKAEAGNPDDLNYLVGKSVSYINKCAMEGTNLSHTDCDVPVFIIDVPERSAFALGELIFFFEFSCAISSYILDINPFTQPRVEDHKKNMFALLGKPGFENRRIDMEKRL